MPSTHLRTPFFVDPHYAQNSRVIHFDGEKACWLLDLGLPPSAENILNYLSENELEPRAILLTHAHADHIAGISEVLKVYPDLPVYLARKEWGYLSDPAKNLSSWRELAISIEAPNLMDLPDGQQLELGTSLWQILDTSGHSPGGRSLYCPEHKIVLVGDALFAGSIGRTDFPHSDQHRLYENIRKNLLTLPGETRVLTGHGPDTTIEAERETNPYVGKLV